MIEAANASDPCLPHEYTVISNVSKILGILSLMVWLFAQLPQVLENHLNESVDGISLMFLICWISGDATNLISCILSRALPFQICLAAYYCFIDFILSVQFWYYTRVYPRQKIHHNMLQSPNMMRPVLSRGSTHNVHHSRTNRFETPSRDQTLHRSGSPNRRYRMKRKSFILKLISSSILSSSFGKANAMPIGKEAPASSSKLDILKSVIAAVGPVLLHWRAKLSLGHYNSASVGATCGWISSCLYLSSRSPQIWKNYMSKSTKGVSPYLFLFAMIGNTFYTISVVSDLYLLGKYDQYMGDTKFEEVFLAQLPFIVGSSGTVIFDSILLFQFWRYKSDFDHPPPMSSHADDFGHNLHFNASVRNDGNRHHRKGQSKHKLQSSILHFTKPDWYTNNYSNDFDENDDYSGHYNYAVQRYGATNKSQSQLGCANKTQGERTHQNEMSSLRNLAFNIPPPPHYVSSSSSNSHNMMQKQSRRGISGTFSAITRSFSHSSSVVKSPSMSSSHSGSVAASPMAGTSLLPSLVGTYSSVSKKMMNESKIPFLPSDFLHDEFTNRSSGPNSDI